MAAPGQRIAGREALAYAGVALGCLLAATLIGWTPVAVQVNNDAYDWLTRLHPRPQWERQAVVLAIDEETLTEAGGVRYIRPLLTEGLERIAPAQPKAVAIDVILADRGDATENAALAAAMQRFPRLVLATSISPRGSRWEEPQPVFRAVAHSLGHVHSDLDAYDSVSRTYALEKVSAGRRYWALSLEMLRLWTGAPVIAESPDDLTIGDLEIPAPRLDDARRTYVLYAPPDGPYAIPVVTLAHLRRHPDRAAAFRGKAVFVGITALSAAQDSVSTPQSITGRMAGVEVHANAFETLRARQFLTMAPESQTLGLTLLLAATAALIFTLLSGWRAFAAAALLLGLAHALPHWLFLRGTVLPYTAPLLATWMAVAGTAVWQHFSTRRRLAIAERERTRYQHAIQFMTHEMRTPLTAIQGSSELMGRYALTDDKRQQMAQMINAESKRLARIIQTFLDVERLSAGHLALRMEAASVAELLGGTVERVRPLAERKGIAIVLDQPVEGTIQADRELLEYAVYNLLTNAVKYSPEDTTVRVSATARRGLLRIAVADQGMGLDENELRNVFRKFYRTRRAEDSGEVGTGIGLSLVAQIMESHGGTIEVESTPGQGSRFTLQMPRFTPAGHTVSSV